MKLLDFGIAKAAGMLRNEDTRTGVVKGQFAYMSPEKASGHVLDHRSDLFAVGTVLHELLTLRPLFRGANDLATLRLVIAAEVPPLEHLGAEWNVVLAKLLAVDPAARFQSGEEAERALLKLAGTGGHAVALCEWARAKIEDAPVHGRSRLLALALGASRCMATTGRASSGCAGPVAYVPTPSPRRRPLRVLAEEGHRLHPHRRSAGASPRRPPPSGEASPHFVPWWLRPQRQLVPARYPTAPATTSQPSNEGGSGPETEEAASGLGPASPTHAHLGLRRRLSVCRFVPLVLQERAIRDAEEPRFGPRPL